MLQHGYLMQPTRPPFIVPEDAQLSDSTILMKHLLDASAYARGAPDGAGFARLLEAAAQALQQQAAEATVQRGLAIASQTLASELALKCEQLQQQQHGGGGGDVSSAPPPPIPMLTGGTPIGARSAAPPTSLPSHRYSPELQPSAVGLSGDASGLGGMAPGGANAVGLMPMDDASQLQSQSVNYRSDAGAGGISASPAAPKTYGGARTWVSGEQSELWGGVHNGPGSRPSQGSNTIAGSASASSLRQEMLGAADAEAERQVDGMVFNLKQRFKQSGVTLPLEKHSGSIYRLGSRKLHLSIRSSRLTVRVGSQNIDFLEYLSKAAL